MNETIEVSLDSTENRKKPGLLVESNRKFDLFSNVYVPGRNDRFESPSDVAIFLVILSRVNAFVPDGNCAKSHEKLRESCVRR